MNLRLVDGKTFEATALREELIQGNPSVWSLRTEISNVTSDEVLSEFVANNMKRIQVINSERSRYIDGYNKLESCNIVYNPDTLVDTCVLRLIKEVN